MKKQLRKFGLAVIAGFMLSACGPGQLFGPTVTPTFTPTPTLPGASGTPVVLVGTPDPQNPVLGASISTESNPDTTLISSPKSAPVFDSGVKILYLRIQWKGRPEASLIFFVTGNKGAVSLGQSFTTIATEYGVKLKSGEVGTITTVTFELRPPKEGGFEDGPYEATILYDAEVIATLNWQVGE